MSETTKSMQQTPVVSPLYLPQVYAILIQNKNLFSTLLESKIRQSWEKDFLTIVNLLGISHLQDEPQPYWDDKVSKKITSKDEVNVEDIILSSPNMRRLYRVDKDRGRFDQAFVVPCEALGLVNYKGSDKNIKFDQPSQIFSEIIKRDGACAATLLLAHVIRIPYSTITNIKVSPRDLLKNVLEKVDDKSVYVDQFRKDDGTEYENKSISKYALGIYSQAFHPWISDVFPSKDDQIPTKIESLIRSILSQEIPTQVDWRKEIPENRILKPVVDMISNLIKEDTSLSVDDKTRLQHQLGGLLKNSTETKSNKNNVLNLIFVGPPGTGKSRILNYIAADTVRNQDVNINNLNEYILRNEQIELDSLNTFKVQFHPSYSYEDFVEGIRPTPNLANPGSVRYAVVPGPLKAASDLAKAYNYNFPENERMIKLIGFISSDKTTNKKSIKIPDEFSIYSFNKRAGTFYLENHSGEFLKLFDSSKSDDGLLCEITEGYQTIFWIPNKVENENSTQQFVLLIDELNRGLPSKIFGEVLSLIEGTKRLGSREQLSIILPSSKERFCLPVNLHMFCTMNLADRSLANLDQAFKRRFKFIYLKPNFDLISNPILFKQVTGNPTPDESLNIKLANHFRCINDSLKAIDVTEDNFIGHSYAFAVLEQVYSGRQIQDVLEDLWRNELHSMLIELMNGRFEEFASAFEKISQEYQTYTIPNNVLTKFLSDSSPGDIRWAA